MYGTYARNRTEAYLHERVQALFEKTPDPILFEEALSFLVEEVARACGLFIGEIHSASKYANWNGSFMEKLVDVRAGKPQMIRIGPDPVPKNDLPPAPPPEVQAETPVPASTELVLPVKPWLRGLNAGRLYMTGQQITRHRERLGLTQGALGAKINMSATCICQWENGKTLPSAKQYAAMRTFFGLPLEGSVDD